MVGAMVDVTVGATVDDRVDLMVDVLVGTMVDVMVMVDALVGATADAMVDGMTDAIVEELASSMTSVLAQKAQSLYTVSSGAKNKGFINRNMARTYIHVRALARLRIDTDDGTCPLTLIMEPYHPHRMMGIFEWRQ